MSQTPARPEGHRRPSGRARLAPGAPDPGFAPAKINLCLHVTGRRADGYHLLDSLVAFAATGDRVTVASGADLAPGLTVEGPEAAGVPAGADNLVLRAARLFPGAPGVRLVLHKALPPASGIGGGSADAAATLRVLARHWNRPLPPPDAVLGLGADVPVCLAARPLRMAGIGEHLAPLPPLPPVWVVLANPRVEVPTPAVFRALDRRDNPPMPAALPRWGDAAALADWLAAMRNDLETPARALAPVVGQVLADLARCSGALLARMSGSGATCFALFDNENAATGAAAALRAERPGWWVQAAPLLPG